MHLSRPWAVYLLFSGPLSGEKIPRNNTPTNWTQLIFSRLTCRRCTLYVWMEIIENACARTIVLECTHLCRMHGYEKRIRRLQKNHFVLFSFNLN